MKSKAERNRIAARLLVIMLSLSLMWSGSLGFALLVSNAETDQAAAADAQEAVSSNKAVAEDNTDEDETERTDKDDAAEDDFGMNEESTAVNEDADNTTEDTDSSPEEATTDEQAFEEDTTEEASNEEVVTEEQTEEEMDETPKAMSLRSKSLRSASSNGTKTITVTKTWLNDDDSVRPDNLTVHIRKGNSVLKPGTEVEAQLKSLSGSGGINSNNTTIHAIVIATEAQYEAKKNSLTSSNIISQDGLPTYAWYENNTIYLYSEADSVYMNPNATGMFRKMRNLTDVSGLAMFNTSCVTDMNRMFQDTTKLEDYSPLSGWDVSHVTSFEFTFGSNNPNVNVDPMKMSSFDFMADWDVSSVSNFNQAFKGCASVPSLDPIMNWDVGRVKNFNQAFNWMQGLDDTKRSVIQDWDVSAVLNWTNMFNNSGGTLTRPIFTSRTGSWNNSGTYSTSVPAVEPSSPPTPPTPPTDTYTEYTDNGSGTGDGTSVGDCIVAKSGSTWTYEFTVPDDGSIWTVWEETDSSGMFLDDKNGLDNAYTESSDGMEGLGGSEDNAIKNVTDSAYITNTNTKRVEITVYKEWDDNSDAAGLRPSPYNDVNIDLNWGGSAVSDTNSDTSKWSGSGNKWTYAKFVHYSHDDASAYEISENSVRGYNNNGPVRVTSTGTQGGIKTGEVTIKNTLEVHDLKVSKEVTGNQADKTKDFSFNVEIQSGSYDYKIYKADGSERTQGTINTSGSFSLKDGEYIEIKDIPSVYTYKVRETDYSSDGYTTDITMTQQGSGDTISGLTVSGSMDVDKDIKYENNKSGVLPTGISFADHPWLIILLISGLVVLMLLVTVIRRNRLQ